jgi:hypothetical protein
LSSFRRRLKGYKHTSDVVSFVRQAQQRSDVVALILFGSLAKEDFYEHSDADVCVVLQQPAVHPLLRDVDAFWQDAPPGIIELHIYGSQQFKQMIRQANGLALEVMHYGVALSGDRFYLTEIERLFRETRRDLSLVRVGNGWVVGQR